MRTTGPTTRWQALALVLALTACQRQEAFEVALRPITRVEQRFDTPRGPARTDFFVTAWGRHPDAKARNALAAQLRALPVPPGTWAVRSAYVYRRTAQLDEDDARAPTELRGSHAHDVVGFARWTDGELDMLLLVEDGMVVFDLLRGEAVEPWEFR